MSVEQITFIIPSSPADCKEITQFLQTASDSLTRIAGEREEIKSIVDEVHEKFDLPKKEIRKWIRIHYEQNVKALREEVEQTTSSYAQIVGIDIDEC